MNDNKNNRKRYLISILLFLGFIALTRMLGVATMVLVTSGFLILGIVSYMLGRKRIQ
ncbi:MAG: hypothetical protein J6E46_09495 [Faecalicoccus sp.]|nr:hypothetical protein [Faecalicoccus sp.]